MSHHKHGIMNPHMPPRVMPVKNAERKSRNQIDELEIDAPTAPSPLTPIISSEYNEVADICCWASKLVLNCV
jgi:hypothetical protein